MPRLFLTVATTPDAVPEASARIARFGAQAGLSELACFQIQVVVAEALNNIVHHGMTDESHGTIEIQCGVVAMDFEITIQDRGMALDILPSDRFPDGRAESGRGWPIMVHWADAVEYHAAGAHNELTLRKRLA